VYFEGKVNTSSEHKLWLAGKKQAKAQIHG
jgi:hypothetical protein